MTGRRFRYPFLVPRPVPLSERAAALRRIEHSGRFSNFGPVNTELEQDLRAKLFGGEGRCCTVANATLGLMLAIRRAVLRRGARPGRYAIMPSFTFAATAHAAMWCGLQPLFCDIDAATWTPDVRSIEALLEKHGRSVAVVIPYATFGNNLVISDYERVAREYDVEVVVDAAASIGSMPDGSVNFGAGSKYPVVYSMHATKTFATAEAGLVYCRDSAAVDEIRSMSNFGFDEERTVTLPGLNAKLSEVGALLALEKLRDFPRVLRRRTQLVRSYKRHLDRATFQQLVGESVSFQFMPVRLAGADRAQRDRVVRRAGRKGVEVRTYFSPPLHQQPFFRSRAKLPVTDSVSSDILSLPLHDGMTAADVAEVCAVIRDATRNL